MAARTVLVHVLLVFVVGGLARAEPSIEPSPDEARADNRLTAIEMAPEAQVTRILLTTEKTPTYTVFKLKDPDRLVVPLRGTRKLYRVHVSVPR